MSQFSFIFFRQLALLLAIFLITAFAANANAAAVDADTKQQIESLKSSLTDLKDSHRELYAKYIQIVGQQNESDKTAFQAKTIADTYTDTAKSIWIPLIGAVMAACVVILVGIYVGVTYLAGQVAEDVLRNAAAEVLEEFVREPVGKAIIEAVACAAADVTAKQENRVSTEALCRVIFNISFLGEDRQDLVETVIDDLKQAMPDSDLEWMISKLKLLLVFDAYANAASKYPYVLECADKALALAKNQDDADVHMVRGITLRRMKKYDDAAVALRRAVSFNSPSTHVYQWALAYCLYEGNEKNNMTEALAAAKSAYFKLQDNRGVVQTYANCLSFSDEPRNVLLAKQLVLDLLQKCKNDKNPIKALIVWRGIRDDLQKEIRPQDYGFAQLLPQT